VLVLAVAGLFAFSHFFPEKAFDLATKGERMKARLEQKSITVNGLNIAYLDGGTGEPLILVHGFGGNKDNWDRVSQYLTHHFRVIAPDLPGFGDSAKKIDLDYSLAGQARWLHDFAKSLGLPSFHLGGNSMGGAIAGVYASLYGPEVKSLWLLAPGAVNAPEESEYFKILKTGKNPLMPESARDFSDMMGFVCYQRPYIPSFAMKVMYHESAEGATIRNIVFKAIRSEKTRIDDLLKGSTIPALVEWGDHDRVLHMSGAGVLCSKMASAQCVILKNTGHVPMFERPEESADAFLAFMKIPGPRK
jgi:pimeloyl-ACP methyl ester carboxylesterase